MAKVADVEIHLRAQVATLERDLAKANSQVSRFARDTESKFTRFASVAARAALPIAAIGTALGLATKKAIDFASEIVDTARGVGISTDALQELRFAAAQSGTDIGVLDGALAKLNKTAGDAAGGNKAAAEAFKRLGVDFRDANGAIKSTDSLFTEVISRLGDLSSVAERNSVAAALLGRSYQELGKLATEGAGGIDELRNQARELGLVLDGETLIAAEKAGDKFSALFEIMKIRGVDAVLALTPALDGLSTAFTAAALAAGEFFDRFRDASARTSIEGISNKIAELDAQILSEGEGIADIEEGWRSRLPDWLTDAPSQVARITDQMRELRAERDALIARRADLTVGASGGGVSSSGQTVLLPPTADGSKAAKAMAREQEQGARLMQSLLEERLRSEGKVIELIMERSRVQEEEIRSATLSQEQREQALRDLAIITDAQVRAAVDAQGALGGQAEEVGEIEQAFGDLGQTASSVFASMVADGELSFSALGDAMKRELIEKGIVVVADQLAKLFASFNFAGGFSSAFGLIGLASGGVVTKPTIAMIGEAGPEAVIPLSRLGSGGGGGNVQVTVIEAPGTKAHVSSKRTNTGTQIDVQVVNMIAANIAGGGAIGKTLEKSYGLSRRGERSG